ncbi:MAG: hypothetical protein RBT74_03585 [Tenuifilaceae bacterium]|jgi:hypothetical protein|nr:hypothetical protein [Tenuifilaceae bacterium]
MKTNNTKRPYEKPAVRRIQLDSEISLVMQSSPKGNPGWANAEESSTPNPFRDEEYSC